MVNHIFLYSLLRETNDKMVVDFIFFLYSYYNDGGTELDCLLFL